MKVIIVEVTRAANSFGQTHLAKISEAYELIGGIVEQGPGRRRVQAPRSTPRFAAMAFYGVIEQVLTGWIFARCPAATRNSSGQRARRRDDLRRTRRRTRDRVR